MTDSDEIFQIWQYFGGTNEHSELTIKEMNEFLLQQASYALCFFFVWCVVLFVG